MGKRGLVNGLMARGGGMLAIRGIKLDGTGVEEMGVGVFAGLKIASNGGGNLSACFTRDGNHDDDVGFGNAALAEFGQRGDDVFGFRCSVFSEVDEDDFGTGH